MDNEIMNGLSSLMRGLFPFNKDGLTVLVTKDQMTLINSALYNYATESGLLITGESTSTETDVKFHSYQGPFNGLINFKLKEDE